MSRNLYTFAVVSPRLLDWDTSFESLRPFDIFRLLEEHQQHFAFFTTVLDGWSHTHKYFLDEPRPNHALHAICSAIDRQRFCLCSSTSDMTDPGPISVTDQFNDYAIVLFAQALRSAIAFSIATRCPLLVTHETLGPSLGDDTFTPPPFPRLTRPN